MRSSSTLLLSLSLIALLVCVQADDNDWANLAKYNESDAQLAVLPKGTNQVIFMGDSITENWGTVGRFFPGKPFVNRGIGGQITPQMLVRLRPDVVNLQPDVLVILGGVNDIGLVAFGQLNETLNNLMGNIFSMAEIAKKNNISVVISSLLPTCGSVKKRIPNDTVRDVNNQLKTYAALNDMIFLNYFPALVNILGEFKKELTIDCLHPNADGYTIMEPLALQAISAALNKKGLAGFESQKKFLDQVVV